MDSADFQNLLKRKVVSAYLDAKRSHEVLFKNSYDFSQQSKALACLHLAMYDMSIAESIYYNNIDTLKNSDLEKIFHQFKVFCREMTTNFSRSENQQWADIEFAKLSELIEASTFSPQNL